MGSVMSVGVILIGLVSGGVAVGLGILCHPYWLVWFIQKLQPRITYYVPMKVKCVALTLDDGPQSNITPKLLDILKKNKSKATYFIIGNHMDACPHLVKSIFDDGHEVGNHTMADVPSWRLSKEVFEDQLAEVDKRINPYIRKDSCGKALKWFRPGHGFYNSSIVSTCEKHGYRIALGSLYPMDHMFQNQAKLLVMNILWRVHPGAVIVLHDRVQQWKQTPQVLELLLPELRKRGYKIVTLSELVQIGARENAQLNSGDDANLFDDGEVPLEGDGRDDTNLLADDEVPLEVDGRDDTNLLADDEVPLEVDGRDEVLRNVQ